MSGGAAGRLRRWLAIAGLLAGLWLGLNAEPRRTGIAADSAAIYGVLLDDLPHAAPIRQPIRFVEATPARGLSLDLNLDQPPPSSGLTWLLQALPGAESATVADFERRLKDRRSLRGLLPRARVWLVERDPVGEPEHPVALAPLNAFSHIGFNAGRTQAIVYVSYVCGGMCGDGHYVLLERTGRRWRISRHTMSWIS
jgi:hypothetical protein